MIVSYQFIEDFFKQDTFTDVDLDNLYEIIEKSGYSDEERRSIRTSINMHLAAFSMGTTLKHPVKKKNRYPKNNNIVQKKNGLIVKKSKVKTSTKKNRKKSNNLSNPKNLTSRLKKALNKINKVTALKTSGTSKSSKKTQTKAIKAQTPTDKKTLEIREMLKKRGDIKNPYKGERFQKYRGSKNTYVKIIYTRMS